MEEGVFFLEGVWDRPVNQPSKGVQHTEANLPLWALKSHLLEGFCLKAEGRAILLMSLSYARDAEEVNHVINMQDGNII